MRPSLQALQGVPLALLAVSLSLKRHPRRVGPRGGMLWRVWLGAGNHQRIELHLHPWFGLTLIGVTWLLAQAVLPRFFPGWSSATYWLVGLSVAAIDALAALFHELGHAWVAIARGRRVSRITLYGLTAAVRRTTGPVPAYDQVLIAMAGPLSHLLLAGALWAVWSLLPDDNEPLRAAAGLPALTNFAAGLLNLLPVAPLDGSRAARALTTVFRGIAPPAIGVAEPP